MKKSLETKLQQMLERSQEVMQLLSDTSVIADQNKFKVLSKEYAQLEPVANCFNAYLEAQQNYQSLQEISEGNDPELANLAKEELPSVQEKIETLEHDLQLYLVPKDINDSRNVYLEIRAGTGGDEAAIFAGSGSLPSDISCKD